MGDKEKSYAKPQLMITVIKTDTLGNQRVRVRHLNLDVPWANLG